MSDLIAPILESFTNHDRNADGVPAVEYLRYAPFENPQEVIAPNAKPVLVLIEPFLLQQPNASDLLTRLARFKADLKHEGFSSRFIEAAVYGRRGTKGQIGHQDGRTLLAIRTMLQQVRQRYQLLQGVILVGDFPEAMLVRRWIWRRKDELTINGQKLNKEHFRLLPEIVAHRSEIVLADLDGAWFDRYYQDSREIEYILALPEPSAGNDWLPHSGTFVSSEYARGRVAFEDFFFVDDAQYSVLPMQTDNKLRVQYDLTARNSEIRPADRSYPNPMAMPDILVSRINARNTALSFYHEAQQLDADGKPQAFTLNGSGWTLSKRENPVLEMQLLIEFFDRDHTFRVGGYSHLPFRPAAITFDEEGDFPINGVDTYVRAASPRFAPTVRAGQANLIDYVNWLKQPAVLRAGKAHATGAAVSYGEISANQLNALKSAVGGNAFDWEIARAASNTYSFTPSYKEMTSAADWKLHRTLYQNRTLAEMGPSMWIHCGCDLMSPQNAEAESYSAVPYGNGNVAESMLFFLNGLALIGRAKVFYDLPTEFPNAFAASPRAIYGEGWKRYYSVDAQNASLATDQNIADRKRAYHWSMIGDWSLRLHYDNGIGVLGLQNGELTSLLVLPNDVWIDSMHYLRTSHRVVGMGRLEATTTRDALLKGTDDSLHWIQFDGNNWKHKHTIFKGETIGAWTLNSGTPDDVIHDVANLTTNSLDEILITNRTVFGILGARNGRLTSIFKAQNGTSLGEWRFNGVNDKIIGTGDFDGDGMDEILITSSWGLGILNPALSTVSTMVIQPHNTVFGEWRFNASSDRFVAIGDFDNDGRDEIAVTSAWGMGLLRRAGNTLTSIAVQANGTAINGWNLNTAVQQVSAGGRFSSDSGYALIARTGSSLRLIGFDPANGKLRVIAGLNHDQWAGEWRFNGADQIARVGDIDSDGFDEIIVKSAWGLGVLKVQNGGFTCIALKPWGSLVGDWRLRSTDIVSGVFRVNAYARAAAIIENFGP